MRSNQLFESFPFDISILALGEFEDLYYATCAKLKELHQGVEILLSNGFKARNDIHFTYHVEPLNTLGEVGVGEFADSLVTHSHILYSHEVTALLDNGIKRRNIRDSKHDGTIHDDQTIHNDLDGIPYFYPRIWGEQEARTMNRKPAYTDNVALFRNARGLRDMSNMSCGMTYAMLAEKYRLMNADGGLNWAVRPSTSPFTTPNGLAGWAERLSRPDTPKVPRAERNAAGEEFLSPLAKAGNKTISDTYVSPYNLEERAKKLNNPGGPEKPCICDEDCICAALCASDPTQNCLCEENSLFVRVTEGMDIDDLDVPDLIRRRRSQSSGSKRSSKTVTAIIGEKYVKEEDELPIPMIDGQLATQLLAEASQYQQHVVAADNHVAEQIRQQKDLATTMAKCMAQSDDAASMVGSLNSMVPSMYSSDLDDALSMTSSTASKISNAGASITPSVASKHFGNASLKTNFIESATHGEISSFSGPGGQPLRTSSLAYREALRQPFAKECPHPPKRASVAERLFGRRPSIQKRSSTSEPHHETLSKGRIMKLTSRQQRGY